MRYKWYGIFLCMIGLVSNANAQQAILQEALQPLHGSLRVAAGQYEGTVLQRALHFNGNTLTNGDNVWQLGWKSEKAGAGWDVTLTCTLVKGNARQTAISVDFAFGQWDIRNYVMVPGIVYNGNRYRAIGNGYSPAYPRDMYYNPASPLTVSNNPRLAPIGETTSQLELELETCNTAGPAMTFFSPVLRRGWIVLTEQGTRFGNNGLSVLENTARDTCAFRLSVPAMRQQAAGFGDFHPSGDRAPDWTAGTSTAIRFRIYAFEGNNIPDLLCRYMEVRKSLVGPNNPRNLVPMSKLAELGTDICRGNFAVTNAGRYYLPENSRNFQLGWVSGMINTFPMLALNDAVERGRVSDELDFICTRMQGKSGFFYGGISAEGQIGSEKAHPDFPAIQAMVRKNGDVLFWLIKHLLLLKAQGHGTAIKPLWELSARKLAAAFTHTWKKYGEFGQYIVPETGEIAVHNSTAGAIVPAGLALAAEYFRQPEWLATAEAAAAYYYQRDVEKQGFTSGGCGDISQDADSETAFGFLESLMALYRYTGKPEWLHRAKVQAALCATWVMAYNPVFPPNSAIGKLKGRMAGAVWASSQNKHAAPGVCTTSADDLFKLYRATGNEQYAELIRDIQHAHAEAVNMPGHITSDYLIGSSMERIQPSDAEGRGSIGNFIHTRNSWTETNGILMAMELPGIYIRPGEGILYVFDHVTATRVKEDKHGVVLRIANPTPYPAAVSVMAETAREAAKPLGYTTFISWPKVTIPSQGEVTVKIKRDGSIATLR